MSKFILSLALGVFIFSSSAFAQSAAGANEGNLLARGKKGAALGFCPLKDTQVKTFISGSTARVNVRQEFENLYPMPIEAVYTFPLSQNGAVDDMTMTVGTRTIKGKIMKRAAARQVYEQARDEGKAASLLDQERPNIFTQSVANIAPGSKIVIEISYVETLKYEDGQYEFVFPMVVGERYIPGSQDPADAAKISPPLATRAGHDISIEVDINAGVPIEAVNSISHDIDSASFSASSSKVTLRDLKTIPNKDFILRYDVSGKRIEDAILTHRDERGGFFSLMLQPPDKTMIDDRTPKEIVFVLDTSGSMGGFPIEKAKEAMLLSLDGLYPDDTFNLITFAGDTEVLFAGPVPATQANIEKARAFLRSRNGSGGTEMMKAIKTALDPSDSNQHMRIVCFMTDGFIGNEDEIIAEIKKHPKARIFSFGIGSSVNRYLLDKMAQNGNGEAEYVTPNDDGSKAARKFYERVRTPLLTDISIEWNGLDVADVYPQKVPDLFSAKPIVLHGRYTKAGTGSIRVKGMVGGQAYSRDIQVDLPNEQAANDVLATLWARRKIDDLMSKTMVYDGYSEEAQYDPKKQTIDEVTNLALEFRLMSSFTSFVAVDEIASVPAGTSTRVEVPAEKVDSSGGGGGGGGRNAKGKGKVRMTTAKFANASTGGVPALHYAIVPPPPAKGTIYGSGTGSGSGSGNGSVMGGNAQVANVAPGVTGLTITSSPQPAPKVISGGVLNGKATSLPKPVYPAAASSVRATGTVAVQVTIDETGKVISATPVSGHPLFSASAVQAARSSTFSPTMLSGQPVKVSGVITYNFGTSGTQAQTNFNPSIVAPGATDEVKVPDTPEVAEAKKRRQILADKLHFWLFSLVEVLPEGATGPQLDKARFIEGDNARVSITLSARTPEVIEKLKSAGLTALAGRGAYIMEGTIPVEKLAEIAMIEEVKVVSPRLR